jgi:hypothetical protein
LRDAANDLLRQVERPSGRHDIVGTGQAKVEAMTNAFRLACRLGLAGS